MAAERDSKPPSKTASFLPQRLRRAAGPCRSVALEPVGRRAGNADAQANTGLIYARGIGCEPRLSARPGAGTASRPNKASAAAELGLGVLYANGHGVEKDLQAAADWYRKRPKGNASAQVALGLMYLSGQGVDRDTEKAAANVRKRPRARQSRAQYELALLMLEGDGPAAQRAHRRKPAPSGARQGSSPRCCASLNYTKAARRRCQT